MCDTDYETARNTELRELQADMQAKLTEVRNLMQKTQDYKIQVEENVSKLKQTLARHTQRLQVAQALKAELTGVQEQRKSLATTIDGIVAPLGQLTALYVTPEQITEAYAQITAALESTSDPTGT